MGVLQARFWALIYGGSACAATVAFCTYNPNDASLFFVQYPEQAVTNLLGSFGASGVALTLYLLGSSALILIPLLALNAVRLWSDAGRRWARGRLVASVGLMLCISLIQNRYHVTLFSGESAGGIVGRFGMQGLARLFDPWVISIILFCLLVSCVLLLSGFAWVRPVVRVCTVQRAAQFFALAGRACAALWRGITVPFTAAYAFMKQYIVGQDPTPVDAATAFEQAVYDTLFWKKLGAQEQAATDPRTVQATHDEHIGVPVACAVSTASSYTLPDVRVLLHTSDKQSLAEGAVDQKAMRVQAAILEEKLSKFGIRGKVTACKSGPVVALFEYQPDIDTPINKIVAREDDLALALQAVSLRIMAPIPGKSVVGFEVSHAKRSMVLFADSVRDDAFTHCKGALPLVLGQTTGGEEVVIDLASLPHLLVAGSTGSGKSVALHTIIMSMLCRTSPDDLRCILVDPKRLEFSAYTDIPHLLFPIVTDPKRVLEVLSWAVATMEERYTLMARAGVRNIYEYRDKYAHAPKGPVANPVEQPALEPMPFIVIMIDELADLMMVAGKDVEERIVRLAQMARAAGIHLILATQRPSVDVITGVIKVNFPARMAFKVISKIDSRTILDTSGAEKLLGKGDMLFLDAQGRLTRVHGAYVTNEEIAAVVQHCKQQRAPAYELLPDTMDDEATLTGDDAVLFKDVVAFVSSVDEVSISLIQRKFRIGYNRSARMIDLLEAQGIVLPAMGGKMRKVLRS